MGSVSLQGTHRNVNEVTFALSEGYAFGAGGGKDGDQLKMGL